ncbi:hypothetical protein DOTSEDRAFT_57500 [Dothistroma septosporum NZE10]|uniref:Uncharacterized protein n=1 Tax=Dothistroma septosporum (strain NZE10 / CBS 128990) TaxID=675120 RepID=N1PDX6_DOTSN|nr:hypothetical protein DOTSEDRAFT_57500 [Dothistroma septosporum NZE10]
MHIVAIGLDEPDYHGQFTSDKALRRVSQCIYGLVLQDGKPIDIIPQDGKVRQASATKRQLSISLAQTCRQIPAGSIKMLWANFTFSFDMYAADSPNPTSTVACEVLPNSIGPSNPSAVRSIIIGSLKAPHRRFCGPTFTNFRNIASQVRPRYAFLLDRVRKRQTLAPACRIYFPTTLVLPSDGYRRAELGSVVNGGAVLFEEARAALALGLLQ